MTKATPQPSAAPAKRRARTTLKIAFETLEQLNAAVRSKYGPRGQGRWIEEAIDRLMARPGFVIEVGAGRENLPASERRVLTVSLTPAAEELLEAGVRRVRRVDPMSEGIQGDIIRTAIRLRLKADSASEQKAAGTGPAAATAPISEVRPARALRKRA